MDRERHTKAPKDLEDLPGTEGWREMYPYYYPFSSPKDMPRKADYENGSFWFLDTLHYPEPVFPLDLTWDDMWRHTGSAWAGRIHVFPRNWGRDHRIVNGRVYINSTEVRDPEEVKKRAPIFRERVAYTLKHWDELFARWEQNVERLIRETESLDVPPLPDIEPMAVITEGKWSSGHDLLVSWNRLMENIHLMWEWHFQFNNIVTLVSIQYIEAVRRLFPGITDKPILQTLSGFEPMVFRAAKSLLALAKSAVDLGLDERLLQAKDWEHARDALAEEGGGETWLSAWEQTRKGWPNLSCKGGWSHREGSRETDPDVPFKRLQTFIGMLKGGDYSEKPLEDVLKERDRVTAEYRELIKDEKDREVFDTLLREARKVSRYPGDQDFYIENWFHSVAYKKFREFGQILADHGVTDAVDDIFFMNRFEIPEVLHDVVASWYCGIPPYGREYWPPRIKRRKEILERFKQWPPPNALGPNILEGKRVLIVDDEQDILDILSQLLSMCRLDVASTFEEAEKLVQERDYDIAVLDIMGVRGYDLLEIANRRNIPALMLTAHALSEEHLRQSAARGAAYYAPKAEITKIDLFVMDVLEAKEKDRNIWLDWFDRLGGFFDRRFGGTGWREKAFWEERIETFRW